MLTLLDLKSGQPVFHPAMFRADYGLTLASTPLGGLAWAGLQLSQQARPATVQASHLQAGIQDALLLQDADQ
jgi:hypothetical protein